MLPSGPQDEDDYARVHALNPLARGVEVDDVIGALRFLIDQPSMTGVTITIDGGQRFMALPRDVQFMERK
jgi:NAD(P)-dependent dehydrogenase (short-subunit alcohol dehydrogenase family)